VPPDVDPAVLTDVVGFESSITDVGAVSLHYVMGGSGPALLLIHGFPQDWYEWRGVLSRLAGSSTVVAVDLRGVGGSDAPDDGYDAATLAGDLHGLVERLELGPVDVVGHDVGGWVAYAYCRLHRATVASATIIETLIPGVEPFAEAKLDVPLWHGQFHMVPDLPEALVADRQEIYFRWFFDVGTRAEGVISDDDVRHYAVAYGDAAHLRAAFEVYRAIPANIAFNDGRREPVDVPLLLVGGEHVFGPVLQDVAANLRSNFGWSHVAVRVVPDGQHYLVEERADDIATLIEDHISRPASP
jgi:pimeloyl-ACP methyl ester carboxylesterase